VVDLPVMRPGQRYTELAKSSNDITVDFIAKAILSKKFVVRERLEEEYQALKELRQATNQEIAIAYNEKN
jgi:urease alpha subunit